MDDDNINLAFQEAISAKVNVISMSLAKQFSSLFSDESDDEWGLSIIDALKEDILVVLPAGNWGKLGLQSIQRTPPWTVTVASCTPTTKFKSKVEFVSDADFYELEDIEGYSISMFSSSSSNDFLPVRKLGDIQDTQSIMYLKNSEILVEPSSDFWVSASIQPVVLLSKEASYIVCNYLESVTAKNGSLYAIIHCSSRKEVGSTPSVSDFSSRGPCRTYTEFMKPDLCAPGEHIVASWPDDMPIGDIGDQFFVPYNVLSGTSFATPLVAAGLAMIKAEKNFSVSATISAAITTANKMHGKDLAFEFAYGAGEFNLEKARQPGLVYEENICVFERFYFSDGKDPPYFHLNLPYFSATFPPHCEEKWAIQFSRN